MKEIVLALSNILWFCLSSVYKSWSGVMIGGGQFQISLSAVVIVAYLLVAGGYWVRHKVNRSVQDQFPRYY